MEYRNGFWRFDDGSPRALFHGSWVIALIPFPETPTVEYYLEVVGAAVEELRSELDRYISSLPGAVPPEVIVITREQVLAAAPALERNFIEINGGMSWESTVRYIDSVLRSRPAIAEALEDAARDGVGVSGKPDLAALVHTLDNEGLTHLLPIVVLVGFEPFARHPDFFKTMRHWQQRLVTHQMPGVGETDGNSLRVLFLLDASISYRPKDLPPFRGVSYDHNCCLVTRLRWPPDAERDGEDEE